MLSRCQKICIMHIGKRKSGKLGRRTSDNDVMKNHNTMTLFIFFFNSYYRQLSFIPYILLFFYFAKYRMNFFSPYFDDFLKIIFIFFYSEMKGKKKLKIITLKITCTHTHTLWNASIESFLQMY